MHCGLSLPPESDCGQCLSETPELGGNRAAKPVSKCPPACIPMPAVRPYAAKGLRSLLIRDSLAFQMQGLETKAPDFAPSHRLLTGNRPKHAACGVYIRKYLETQDSQRSSLAPQKRKTRPVGRASMWCSLSYLLTARPRFLNGESISQPSILSTSLTR